MFAEKSTIYVVVSVPGFMSNIGNTTPKIEGYYAHEYAANAEAERLKTWKTVTVIPQEVDVNDLIRVLNHLNGAE